jgi:hypothetical protein
MHKDCERVKDSAWNMKSVPSAVADGLKTHLISTNGYSAAGFAGLESLADLIPGLCSLRSLHPGLLSSRRCAAGCRQR